MKKISDGTKTGRRAFLGMAAAGLAGLAMTATLRPQNGAKENNRKPGRTKSGFRTLGTTGLTVPVIGMGAVNTLNPELIKAAQEAGIIYFDTGHYYLGGRNEVMLGGVFKTWARDSFLVSTKVLGEHENQIAGTPSPDFKPEVIMAKFETSLKRLNVGYADIFLLHNIGSRSSALHEPYLFTLAKLKKEGKARFVGLSTHINEPEVIRAAVESRFYDVVMTAYNFRQPHRLEVEAAIAEAARAGLGVIAMKTQAGVYWDPERRRPINMKAALKWAIRNPNVHTAIPGFTSFDQLEQDWSVMTDPELTPGEIRDLFRDESASAAGLYCAQCGLCRKQCPAGLEIPTLMRGFMYAYGYQNTAAAKAALRDANPEGNPCFKCRSCSVRCASGFDVKDRIIRILRLRNLPDEFLFPSGIEITSPR